MSAILNLSVRHLLIAGSVFLALAFIFSIVAAALFDADDDLKGTCFFQPDSSPYYQLLVTAAVFLSISLIMIVASVIIFNDKSESDVDARVIG